jgi:hypothetical protein
MIYAFKNEPTSGTKKRGLPVSKKIKFKIFEKVIREFHFSEKGGDRFEIMIKFVYNTEMILQFVIPLEQCVLKIKELFESKLWQTCIILI